MKKQKGFTLIEILVVLTIIVIALAGGIVVWEKKVSLPAFIPRVTPFLSPAPTTPYGISPLPTPSSAKVIGPTTGGPVSPGVFEGDLRDLPTITPIPPGYFSCKTDADCYDEEGKPKGVCEVPCQDKAVCRNGTCYKPSIPGAICLGKNTLVDTPGGQVPVHMLRKGMSVWTVGLEGERQPAPIIRTMKTAVDRNHQVVHLILKDSRELFASAGHPTADGRILSQLSPGDILDGSRVVSAKLIPYQEDYTYDILPGGETGLYWANGILLKSTLVE